MILHYLGYTGTETTWANEMNFIMNHAPGAGSLARPVGKQSSTLPLYLGCLHGWGQPGIQVLMNEGKGSTGMNKLKL